jgi:hypothetical protein
MFRIEERENKTKVREGGREEIFSKGTRTKRFESN